MHATSRCYAPYPHSRSASIGPRDLQAFLKGAETLAKEGPSDAGQAAVEAYNALVRSGTSLLMQPPLQSRWCLSGHERARRQRAWEEAARAARAVREGPTGGEDLTSRLDALLQAVEAGGKERSNRDVREQGVQTDIEEAAASCAEQGNTGLQEGAGWAGGTKETSVLGTSFLDRLDDRAESGDDAQSLHAGTRPIHPWLDLGWSRVIGEDICSPPQKDDSEDSSDSEARGEVREGRAGEWEAGEDAMGGHGQALRERDWQADVDDSRSRNSQADSDWSVGRDFDPLLETRLSQRRTVEWSEERLDTQHEVPVAGPRARRAGGRRGD